MFLFEKVITVIEHANVPQILTVSRRVSPSTPASLLGTGSRATKISNDGEQDEEKQDATVVPSEIAGTKRTHDNGDGSSSGKKPRR